MPLIGHDFIPVRPAEMFSHEDGHHPPVEDSSVHREPRGEGMAPTIPSQWARLMQWAGMQLWTARAWILAALGAALIFSTAIALVVHFTGRPRDELVDNGILTVLQCLACHKAVERRIHNLADERCPACGGRMGTAYTCLGCGHQFPFDEDQVMTLDGNEYRCPECGSLDTVPTPTSGEPPVRAVDAAMP